jgi:competence transcription factor ComK
MNHYLWTPLLNAMHQCYFVVLGATTLTKICHRPTILTSQNGLVLYFLVADTTNECLWIIALHHFS